jgi:WD40 repeat protein
MEMNNLNNQIEITFTTSLPEEFQIENNRISVPTSYDPDKLNKLLNKLLSKDGSKKFIFFIENFLLDSALNTFLSVKNFDMKKISETGLVIHYSLDIPHPEKINTIKEDEWIRKIVTRKNQKYDTNNLEPYIVGLFNSEISVYNPQFEKVLKIEDDNTNNKENEYCELLHDVLFFTNVDSMSRNTLIKASRNEEALFSIYSLDILKASYIKVFHAGKNSEYCNSLSLNPVDFSYFASGNTDGSIQIFKLKEDCKQSEPGQKRKKRKTETQVLYPEVSLEDCHGANEVRIIKWINNGQILSTGDDFYVKLWNIQTKSLFSSFNTNYKLTTSICPIFGNEKFLTGHEDGSIRLWDIRNENTRIVFNNAHAKYVSDIATNPDTNEFSYNFSTTGYDGRMKVWDTRAMNKPLNENLTDSGKNYTLSYNTPQFLLTGGDSSSVNVYQNKI